MALTLYGTSHSRAARVLWMLEEAGLAYEHQPISFMTSGQDPAYLAINPAGSVPCLVDDGFALAESLAINLYVAQKHRVLWPAEAEAQALALQWSFFAATSFEPEVMRWGLHSLWLPKDRGNPEEAKAALAALQRPLARLELALQKNEWILGSEFSVADLNVAGVLWFMQKEFVGFPKVSAWLARALARQAYARVQTKD